MWHFRHHLLPILKRLRLRAATLQNQSKYSQQNKPLGFSAYCDADNCSLGFPQNPAVHRPFACQPAWACFLRAFDFRLTAFCTFPYLRLLQQTSALLARSLPRARPVFFVLAEQAQAVRAR